MKDVYNKYKFFWKKLKAELIETIQQDIYFTNITSNDVFNEVIS